MKANKELAARLYANGGEVQIVTDTDDCYWSRKSAPDCATLDEVLAKYYRADIVHGFRVHGSLGMTSKRGYHAKVMTSAKYAPSW